MSYILEALRRSQQERELGNMQTSATDVNTEPVESGGINSWVFAALALAASAVVIALYAALQARPSVSEQVQAPPLPVETLAPAQDNGDRIRLEDQHNLSVTNRRLPPAARGEAVPEALIDDVGAAIRSSPPYLRSLSLPRELSEEERELPAEEQEPLVEPPPPKPRAAPTPTARPAPRPAAVTGDFDVPDDVVRDIETFKEELRLEQSVDSGRPVPKQPEPKDPRDLRLPKEVALRQPAFVMTVHVHEKERDKRFVVINARKYREGDTTREGLIVEEILPDGAILSIEGHRFFSRR